MGVRARETYGALGPGDGVRLVYRLGKSSATGLLEVAAAGVRTELIALRRGHQLAPQSEADGRQLARIAALPSATWRFDGGFDALPTGTHARPIALVNWARTHLERQLTTARADAFAKALAGVRIRLIATEQPPAELCDATDDRILAALSSPVRVDQVLTFARAPRYRLLGLLYFLERIDALEHCGVAAGIARPLTVGAHADLRIERACRTLGISVGASLDAIRQAYRQRTRDVHPDMHPGTSEADAQTLTERLREIQTAYRTLVELATL